MDQRYQINGFLPWRGPFVLDVIVIAMVFVLIALAWSVYSVKYRSRYQRHKVTQLCLAGGLLILLVCFEIDIQFFENWRQRADASPYYNAVTRSGLVVYSLWIHLFFATTTLALWLLIIVKALNAFPQPAAPQSAQQFSRSLGHDRGDRYGAHSRDRLGLLLPRLCRLKSGMRPARAGECGRPEFFHSEPFTRTDAHDRDRPAAGQVEQRRGPRTRRAPRWADRPCVPRRCQRFRAGRPFPIAARRRSLVARGQ